MREFIRKLAFLKISSLAPVNDVSKVENVQNWSQEGIDQENEQNTLKKPARSVEVYFIDVTTGDVGISGAEEEFCEEGDEGRVEQL